jgi:hypothetical protein
MNVINRTCEFAVDPTEIVNAQIRRDMLAETIEILIAEAVVVLTACRHADDEFVVEQFSRLDTVYRTAKLTAKEIRDSRGVAR